MEMDYYGDQINYFFLGLNILYNLPSPISINYFLNYFSGMKMNGNVGLTIF